MSRASDIISRALQDRFSAASNSINIAQDFTATLWRLARAANGVFDEASRSVSGAGNFIMDINEAGLHSPLRDGGRNEMVIFATLHDTSTDPLRSRFVQVPEPGLILKFNNSGHVFASTTKTPLPDENVKNPKIARGVFGYHIMQRQGLEDFVGSWLRANLDAKTLVAVQEALEKQDEKDAEDFWLWSPAQLERLKAQERLRDNAPAKTAQPAP